MSNSNTQTRVGFGIECATISRTFMFSAINIYISVIVVITVPGTGVPCPGMNIFACVYCYVRHGGTVAVFSCRFAGVITVVRL